MSEQNGESPASTEVLSDSERQFRAYQAAVEEFAGEWDFCTSEHLIQGILSRVPGATDRLARDTLSGNFWPAKIDGQAVYFRSEEAKASYLRRQHARSENAARLVVLDEAQRRLAQAGHPRQVVVLTSEIAADYYGSNMPSSGTLVVWLQDDPRFRVDGGTVSVVAAEEREGKRLHINIPGPTVAQIAYLRETFGLRTETDTVVWCVDLAYQTNRAAAGNHG